MPRRAVGQASSLARKATELSVAAPRLIAHRPVPMALAGPVPGPRERKEFFGMIAEKQLAFAQCWLVMLIEVARVSQRLALLAGPASWLAFGDDWLATTVALVPIAAGTAAATIGLLLPWPLARIS